MMRIFVYSESPRGADRASPRSEASQGEKFVRGGRGRRRGGTDASLSHSLRSSGTTEEVDSEDMASDSGYSTYSAYSQYSQSSAMSAATAPLVSSLIEQKHKHRLGRHLLMMMIFTM